MREVAIETTASKSFFEDIDTLASIKGVYRHQSGYRQMIDKFLSITCLLS